MQLSELRSHAICAAILLIAALPLDAQSIPSPFKYLERGQEAGPFGGYASTSTGRFGYGPGSGPLLGLRYAVELSGPLSFEGVASYLKADRDVVDPGREEGDRVIGVADGSVMMLDARLRFTFTGRRSWNRLAPFLSAGGGMAFGAASGSDLDDQLLAEDVFDFGTSFYGSLGLGSRLFLTDRFALRGEWLFSLWELDTPPGYADPERNFTAVDDGEWLWKSALVVSLLYRW